MQLREFMRRQDITIQAMADSLEVSTGTIHNIFRGRDIKLSLAMKIEERTFGHVTCKDLLKNVIDKYEDAQNEADQDDSSD